jgi:hypothetical protein
MSTNPQHPGVLHLPKAFQATQEAQKPAERITVDRALSAAQAQQLIANQQVKLFRMVQEMNALRGEAMREIRKREDSKAKLLKKVLEQHKILKEFKQAFDETLDARDKHINLLEALGIVMLCKYAYGDYIELSEELVKSLGTHALVVEHRDGKYTCRIKEREQTDGY